MRYVEQRDGIADVLGCGCTSAVECGYHREQTRRTAARAVLDAPPVDAAQGPSAGEG